PAVQRAATVGPAAGRGHGCADAAPGLGDVGGLTRGATLCARPHPFLPPGHRLACSQTGDVTTCLASSQVETSRTINQRDVAGLGARHGAVRRPPALAWSASAAGCGPRVAPARTPGTT